tara:strand:+ start:442 stop:873 length:432 start_codon:yes stop_codon:yes gene_type:complete
MNPDESMFALLTKEEFDQIENQFKLFRGDTVVNNRRPTPSVTQKPTKSPEESPNESSGKSPGKPKPTQESSAIALDEQYRIDEEKAEVWFTNVFQSILNFLKSIARFFYNINYSNPFVQITILVGIFYVITTMIGALHINITI